MLQYFFDRYKIPEMCKKADGACPIALKHVPDWFVTSKMHKIIDNVSLDEIIIWRNAYLMILLWITNASVTAF